MKILLGSAMLFALLGCPLQGQTLQQKSDHALEFARLQLLRTVREIADTVLYPRSTRADGSWRLVEASDWTSGFFPGLLWMMYEHSHEQAFLTAARRWTAGLESQKDNRTTHDLGFMLYSSFGNGWRIQQDRHYREVLLEAARTLASRFNARVGCIKSWDWSLEWQCPVIIDNMMNLELLFWAARNGGGDSLRTMAISHADRTIENHIRPDGSTVHVVNYDSSSGAVIAKVTHQGASAQSTWARGQAWAVYGFTVCYRETHQERFLKAAERLADYFVDHLPEDAVPCWDFATEEIPETQRDASAGAIAASGLLELARLLAGEGRGETYRSAAERILGSLTSPAYLAEGTPSHGILAHAVGDKPHMIEVDASLIYADYYVVEALLRHAAMTAGN
jgi:unsaturated chondroitin disaccharide hydrolase